MFVQTKGYASSPRGAVFGFFVFVLGIITLALFAFAGSAQAYSSPATVNLGAAGNYVILSKSGITTTGTTAIIGDIGVSPIDHTAITGFGALPLDVTECFSTTPLVAGQVFAADYSTLGCTTPAALTTAVSNMEAAYTDAATRPTPDEINPGSGELGGLTLAPGLYNFTTGATISTNVTLNGSASDIWIFQIPGTLNIASCATCSSASDSAGIKVLLTGGAQASNVFWAVADATTLGTYSTFEGNILAATNIAMQDGAVLHGRALAQTAVTLIGNTVSATAPTPPSTGPVFIDNGDDILDVEVDQDFATIQAAVDTAVNGDTIFVTAGMYNENLNIDRPVTLQSVSGVSATTISGATGTVVTISSSDVTVTGFTITNGGVHGMGIYSADKSNLTITNNIITNIGNGDADVMGRGVVIVSSADNSIDNINISNNQINNITSGMRTTTVSVSASGVSIGWSTGTGDITNLVLDGNTISDISADTSPWTGTTKGQGANGILINHARGDTGNTGHTVAPQITNNTISNLSGLWSHAIGLEGNTPDAVLSNNTISNFSSTKTPSDAFAIFFEDNAGKTTVSIDGVTYGATTTVAVNAEWNGLGANPLVSLNGESYIFGVNAFSTIQGGIDAVAAGGTVNVAAGTYTETGQIVINKNLSIVGNSSNKPIIRPTGDFLGDTAAGSWWLVEGGVTFNLSNVVVDGNTSLINRGLRSHGNTTIDNVDFTNIKGNAYQGMAVASFGGTVPGGAGADSHSAGGVNAHLTITNSTFANIGRIGVLVKGTGSTATLTGNTYTGKGGGDFLDYAFEFGAGGSGTISGNTISGNRGVAISDGSTSAGILVTEYYGSGTNAIVNGNTFSNNSAGLHVGYLDTDASVVTANGNNFGGETVGVESDATTVTVNAVQNWWGTIVPTEIAAKKVGLVNIDPWYTNTEMTILSDATVTNATYTSTTEGQADLPNGATEVTLTDTTVLDLSNATTTMTSTPVTIGGNTVTLTQSVTLQSGVDTEPVVLTNSNLANISASIPDGTIIQGPAEWDGTITPPVSVAPSGTAPAGFSVGGTVISIGSPDGTLVFSNPVTILLAGVTGAVGYKPAGSSTWVQITNVCADPYLTPGNPPANSECAISNGTDTKIVTYHFTSFGGLDPIPAPTPTPSGGGGGGIIGSGGTSYGVVNTSNYPGVTPAEQAAAVAAAIAAATPAAQPVGQVLGATTYRFGLALAIGSTGNEVIELQNRLTSEGVYSGPVTGYFGSLTAQAVKKFQEKYGISQVGVVGPQTREKLNSGTGVAIPGCTGDNKFSTETGKSCVASATMGAAVSAFTRSLQHGSTGDDVTRLQERLIKEGVYSGPVTGYFGNLTSEAVKKFQEKNGIEQVGVVGPQTRGALNK